MFWRMALYFHKTIYLFFWRAWPQFCDGQKPEGSGAGGEVQVVKNWEVGLMGKTDYAIARPKNI